LAWRFVSSHEKRTFINNTHSNTYGKCLTSAESLITVSTKSNDLVQQAALMCRKRGRIVPLGVVGLELSGAEWPVGAGGWRWVASKLAPTRDRLGL
jgi:hypothetical protein